LSDRGHQGEQAAGGGDLGDVAGLLAAAGDDALADRAGQAAGGHVLDGLDQRPPQQPGPLLGDMAVGDLGVGLAVAGGQPGPRAQLRRALASEYAVARTTVRRALGELRKRKLIKTLHGHGNAVVAMPAPGGLPG
jgi:Bacterial regulatory proteins, gntR family